MIFSDLCELIDILRAPDGCPWDREQNHKSIRKGLIEETYEVVEGIDKSDDKIMCEELGDLLMQVVFHAAIARDENAFDLNDICTGICKKADLPPSACVCRRKRREFGSGAEKLGRA